MHSEKIVNATVQALIDTLLELPEEVLESPIGVHSMGNGIDIRVDQDRGVQLVGFNETDLESYDA